MDDTSNLDRYIAAQYAKLLRNLVADTNCNKFKFFLDKFCHYAGIEHKPFNVSEDVFSQKQTKTNKITRN